MRLFSQPPHHVDTAYPCTCTEVEHRMPIGWRNLQCTMYVHVYRAAMSGIEGSMGINGAVS